MLKYNIIKTCSNETYSKVHTGKHLSHTFAIQNGLKHGDVYRVLVGNSEVKIPLGRLGRS
jgi:hypothetical protein